jgi:hypothetical protein
MDHFHFYPSKVDRKLSLVCLPVGDVRASCDQQPQLRDRARSNAEMVAVLLRNNALSENGLFEPFIFIKNEYYTKTGSGQT